MAEALRSDEEASLQALDRLVRPHLREVASSWYEQARAKVRSDRLVLPRLFPEAGRRVGHELLIREGLDGMGAPIAPFGERGPVVNGWRVEDAVRVIFLMESALLDAALERTLAELYFHGDLRERIAVLRGLSLLYPRGKGGDGSLPLVRDALRSNTVDLFAAAICENPYASAHVGDELFFQAALKCVFTGLRINRIAAIEARANAELGRMLFGYVTEREHAGRSIAPELWPILGLFPPEGAAPRMGARLAQSRDPYEQRLLALGIARAERSK